MRGKKREILPYSDGLKQPSNKFGTIIDAMKIYETTITKRRLLVNFMQILKERENMQDAMQYCLGFQTSKEGWILILHPIFFIFQNILLKQAGHLIALKRIQPRPSLIQSLLRG
ncbi:hypothetical protein ACJX0J_017027 [Zea mays]